MQDPFSPHLPMTTRTRRIVCSLLTFALACGGLHFDARPASAQSPASSQPAADASTTASPEIESIPEPLQRFLIQHCTACHAGDMPQSEFKIDPSSPPRFLDPATRSQWSEIVNVLNSHEMPPEDEPQPEPADVAQFVDWVTEQLVVAEQTLRENRVVMRRLNRIEFKNTIRELVGIEFDVSGFPQDPPASGFDNIGAALTMSPMQIELHLDAAYKIMTAALVDGPAPPSIRWRFEVDSGDSDANRVRVDGQTPIVNGGNNPVSDGWKKLHHNSWDKTINVRDFAMRDPGNYILRIRAAGVVPSREQVIESARAILQRRLDDQLKENPKGEQWHREAYTRDLEHFRSDRMYDYGPPRLKLIQDLGGQPKTITEFDVSAPLNQPQIFEIPVSFSTARAGVTIEYAYSIPSVLENFWFQNHDAFARPELLVDWLEIEGPLHPAWPPESHQRLMPETLTSDNEQELAETTIGRFVRRAFRRPVSREEVAPYLERYVQSRSQQQSPIDALRSALASVLVSPHFLYLVEGSGQDESPRVTPHQLASRLSYFLWSAPPDTTLMQSANQGILVDPETLREQTTRMLSDPRSEELIRNFADQWLGLRDVGANPPAIDLYPHYDRHLELSMIEEGRALLRTILREGLPVLDLVDPEYVVINERLARFYDIPNVRGDAFRSVPLNGDRTRGGILTQAAMLTTTSNGTRTSPVKRGTWILKNVLGTDPGLPVANAGDIAPKVPGIDKATVRQRLEIHRELPQCARCHDKIDPLGLALENYNASGQYRLQEGFGYKGRIERDDPSIDATARLPNGTSINGPAELKRALRARDDQFLHCLAQKLLTYALGREVTLADAPTLRNVVRATQQGNYRLDAMIQAIVQSESFLNQ
jgi:hypothetical protein